MAERNSFWDGKQNELALIYGTGNMKLFEAFDPEGEEEEYYVLAAIEGFPEPNDLKSFHESDSPKAMGLDGLVDRLKKTIQIARTY